MNGILGMTELVNDTDLTTEQRDSLGLVKLSAEALISVINDILDFSKIEAGKLGLESIPFDLRESLGETMGTLGFRAHQKGLELMYEVQPDLPESFVGDPGASAANHRQPGRQRHKIYRTRGNHCQRRSRKKEQASHGISICHQRYRYRHPGGQASNE